MGKMCMGFFMRRYIVVVILPWSGERLYGEILHVACSVSHEVCLQASGGDVHAVRSVRVIFYPYLLPCVVCRKDETSPLGAR